MERVRTHNNLVSDPVFVDTPQFPVLGERGETRTDRANSARSGKVSPTSSLVFSLLEKGYDPSYSYPSFDITAAYGFVNGRRTVYQTRIRIFLSMFQDSKGVS